MDLYLPLKHLGMTPTEHKAGMTTSKYQQFHHGPSEVHILILASLGEVLIKDGFLWTFKSMFSSLPRVKVKCLL